MSHTSERFRVHFLDQDPIGAVLLQGRLQEVTSVELETFRTGQECLLNFHSDPNVVVLDYRMMGAGCKDAFELIDEMKRRNSNVRFILFSDHYDREIMFRMLNDPAVSYLPRNGGRFFEKIQGMICDLAGQKSRKVA